MSNAEKTLLGVTEVAKITGLDTKSIRKLAEAQLIPAVRIGRVWRVSRWWVEEQRTGPRVKAA